MERGIRWCFGAGWSAAQAVGLGLLDGDELVRLTIRRFDKSSNYSDPVYVTSAGLWGWEREAIRLYFPSTGRIVIGAAGSGREMIALHRAGYTVEGFECSRKLVEAGQRILADSNCRGGLRWAAPGEIGEHAGPFDAAIMGWSGYMYIPNRAQRVKLLLDFRELLRPGAPLLVSFQTREHFERRMNMSARGANWIRKIRGAPLVMVGDRLDNGFKHWFDRNDIATEMADAGLRLETYSTDGYGWAVGRA